MTDAELLLLILAGIYLAECARWAPCDAAIFSSPWCGRWRTGWARQWLGNQHGGLVLGNPWPPLGTLFLCQGWPVSLSPEGICGFVAAAPQPGGRPPQSGGAWRWDDSLRVAADGKRVDLNGRPLVRAGSRRHAQELAGLLERLAQLPSAQRSEALEAALQRAVDVSAIRRRIDEFQQATRRLRGACVVLAVFVLFAAPPLVWVWNFWRLWPLLVAALASLVLIVVRRYRLAHRRLHPDAAAERRNHAVLMILSPLTAIRAHDALAWDWLYGFHPLAVARVLLAPDDFAILARRVLLDLDFPLPPAHPGGQPAQDIVLWFRARQRQLLADVVREAGVDLEALLAPPAPEGPDAVAFCPRCREQFASADGRCAACGGQILTPLARTAP